MRPDWKDYVFLVATLGGIFLLGIIFYIFQIVPEDWDSRWAIVTWASTGMVGIATIALLLWRNYLNDRELKEQIKSSYADRFKTGAELLASTNDTVRLSGIVVLKELALEQPDLYGVTVGELLLAYINTSGHEQWARSEHFRRPENAEVAPLPRYTRPPAYFTAFRAMGEMAGSDRLRAMLTDEDAERRVEILRTSLEGISVRKSNFTRFVFFQVVFEAAAFFACDLRKSRFVQSQFDGASFHDCNMAGVNLRSQSGGTGQIDCTASQLTDARLVNQTGTLLVEASDLTTSHLVGSPVISADCWAHHGSPPQIRGVAEATKVFDATGPGNWIKVGRFSAFSPSPECPYWLYEPGRRSPSYVVPHDLPT